MKTIIITRVARFIGTSLALRLLEDTESVRGIGIAK